MCKIKSCMNIIDVFLKQKNKLIAQLQGCATWHLKHTSPLTLVLRL